MGDCMSNKIDIHSTSRVDESCKLTGYIKIGKNCYITNSRLNNCKIGDNVKIVDSNIDGAEIKNNVTVGPYSRIRPDTIIFDNAHIGNFVEIKNSQVGKNTKIPHLSYVGDCEIGKDVNIGCGVVFCNYDGKNKNKSYVGDRVFVGSNCNIIAPVVIENESFIAAGTTVTENVSRGSFCIGRVKNETKHGVLNLYLQNFSSPLKYFGTDGIRGVYGKKLNDELCLKVGYALTRISKKPKIVIGRDTRESGEAILKNLSDGIVSGNGEVYDAGIISTAGVAYLTRFFGFDYGVVITASHNPCEYNGIKVFNKNGYKLNENQEFLLEKRLFLPKKLKSVAIKKIKKDAYIEYLNSICKHNLKGLKIFIDCSNGAVSSYASNMFKQKGAKVVAVNTCGEINKNASVLNEDVFIANMKKFKCDIGFCFDGDADRVMCITKNLKVLDGDKILYIISKYKKEKCVVGTIMTNMAIEKHLKQNGTKLIRTAVGDKYIARILKSKKHMLGAESSGHVILSDLATTGDGLLTALYLMNVYKEKPQLFFKAEQLNIYSTVSGGVKTTNKQILKNKSVISCIKRQEKFLGKSGRIIVRASGTEPKIRITAESKSEEKAKKSVKTIEDIIIKSLENV